MSTIALTSEQVAAKTAFVAFIAGGVQTQIGAFKLDPAVPIVYTIDPTGTKLLASGALVDVDFSKINPTIKPALGTTALPVIASYPMAWDMNGVAKGNQAFNLVQVVS